MRPWAMGSWSPGRKSDKVHGRPWDHGAMERHGAGRVEGAERAERAERRRGRVQSREAMRAMDRDGTMGHRTMEPWSAM